ncbi:MAG: DNA topoisomerase IV subunit A [Candidatus Undinarchaeales archaeon]|jgi:DNA topoisomerase-6 subunit A|nr:DNA topoisomerase IV subunit A [Candidatus Undinarchaeales archaeon]MDP7493554.1 DNA topoisomerase IV subunit A [Candidatus Undinarchaeales archaeon]
MMKSNEPTLESIQALAAELAGQLEGGEEPQLSIPLRTISNVYFDEASQSIRLGNKRFTRSFLNTAHTRRFMQTLLILARCRSLLEEQRHASIREMYYQLKRSMKFTKENTFDDQKESNPLIEDLEVTLDVLREELNLNAKKRGTLYGDITLSQSGDTFNCAKLGRGGWSITSNVEDIEVKDTSAEFVLVIETDAMYERLVEEGFQKKHKCLLIATEGQAPRGARRLIHRLSNEHNLPIIVFTDGDPYGWYIYSVIKQGSINLAYLSKWLSTPDCKFVGMTMDDIEHYGLQNVTEVLKPNDVKRVKEEKKYAWFQDELWQRQLDMALEKKVRIEQQALANKSLQFVADTYLPEKIETEDFLP